MSKLYRSQYDEAEDPEVARMEKQRPRGKVVRCIECGRKDVVLAQEQFNQDMLNPLDQMCDDCLTEVLDDMEFEYYENDWNQHGFKGHG